ncbi:Nramp family divalent metal transporter [Halococcus hamelinensis]|uniref:Mn2+ and Fe2+ transporter-like protein n=1 Tax=Halococcus hamelinensis 100A6 TaxID=1132509 RepID=M0M157_9EURY|nr:Nramp family divalent metal transporter [Halococcus hamelinensis]EMA38110.1 Mn2+ and Fe2+ transporter-like protein [Halococcus hamelinensis 100A6]
MSESTGAGLDGVPGEDFFDKYGLAFVMVASYFGSGSVFIASSAGVQYGYALLWAVVGAVVLGFIAQYISARLGIFGKPLMTFIHDRVGAPIATTLALVLSVGCIAWGLALTAAVGEGISVLLGGAIQWQPIAVACGLLAVVVGILGYDFVEKVMITLMFGLLIAYVVVAVGSGPSISGVAGGFVPGIPDIGALTLVASILGTTALWPNFFLESILVREKGWTDESAIPTMRLDLGVGYAIGGIVTIAIVVATAAVLRPAGITEIATFITPGRALADVLGDWALVLFLVGAIVAAFNSIVPIMWTPAYIIPQATGRDVDSDDRLFRIVYVVGIGISALSPLVAAFFGLGVVDMIVLFPALNGVIGLPITAVCLVWAANNTGLLGEHTNGPALNAVGAVLVVLSVVLGVSSAQSVIGAITGGGL